MKRSITFALAVTLLGAPAVHGQFLLVPMDAKQANHLKAYGLTYLVLEKKQTAEWLLNYRNGSFLLPDRPDVRREAALRGVNFEPQNANQVAQIRSQMEDANMESVILEKAPKIAVYSPSTLCTPSGCAPAHPWDDAVTLAMTYADIPYSKIWDPEVLQGRLKDFDWLHLHHEDFTGQYSKFYNSYAGSAWLQEEVNRNETVAKENGHANVASLKKSVAESIRRYVAEGGFLFAMCAATETLELAIGAVNVDISAPFADGSPVDPDASRKMKWDRTMAFLNAEVQTNPGVNAFSDIDGHQVNTSWKQPLGSFTLFEFSPKFDPVPSMLVQNHESVLPDFYGLTTSFRRDRLKPGVIVLGEEDGAAWTKYVHGTFGQGTWTFLGGHDPEDPQHQIGDEPTDLNLHPHSAGYRLILNNVLFPAAKKKTLKTD